MVTMNSLTDSSKKSVSSEPHAHKVIIALGSNVDHEANICKALAGIAGIVDIDRQSETAWTEPVGMASGMFLNSMVAGKTRLTLGELTDETKKIESCCGRTKAEAAAGRIAIDIDILEYDGLRLHPDDWNRSYIQQLMKEI